MQTKELKNGFKFINYQRILEWESTCTIRKEVMPQRGTEGEIISI